ncbi:MAG: hypothetical protein AAB372_03990 [Patescibacteria group bacterium]
MNNKRKEILIGGQAALGAVLFFVSLSLIVIGAFAALGITQIQAANEILISTRAHATTESGTEDALYRMTQVVFAKPALDVSYDVILNGGDTTMTLSNPGGGLSYTIQAQGQVLDRHRNTGVNFDIVDGSALVHVDDPVQAGHLGVEMYANSVVQSSEGPQEGTAFSNGSIVVKSGQPIVDGVAVVAKGIGGTPWITHNEQNGAKVDGIDAVLSADISTCAVGNGCIFNIGTTSYNTDGAQSFVPNITANIVKLRVFIKPIGLINQSLPIKIFPNKRLNGAGNACSSSDIECFDRPAPTGFMISGNISTAQLNFNNGGTYQWVTVSLNTSVKPLIMNEKYWIVFDTPCSSSGCLSGTAGWALGGLDDLYSADPEYLSVPDAYQNKVGVTLLPKFWTSADVSTGLSGTFNKDIAFEMYLGEAQTSIDGIAGGGDFIITKDAKAQNLYGLDVGNDAFYNTAGMGGTSAVIANTPTSPEICLTSIVGSHCKWMSSSDTGNSNQPPASKEVGPFGYARYRELRKKAASLGTTTPGDITVSSGTTLFPGAVYNVGVIDGDLTVQNSAILELTGKSFTSGLCPFNEYNGAGGKPCYVLRITGDLDIKNDAQIRINCPLPCTSPNSIPSAHIIVDGTITIQNNAQIYGVTTTDGASGMFVTSYSPEVKNPFAIDLKNNSSGSVYFAMRGGVLIQNNMEAKAISGQYIEIQNNAVVTFDAGLINPYSEDGGVQPWAGLDITGFREAQ